MMNSSSNDSKSDPRENVGIVPLPWLMGLSIVDVVWEGGSTGKDGSTVSELVSLLGSTLSLLRWITQGKNHGTFI
jgi:hypothetical protein